MPSARLAALACAALALVGARMPALAAPAVLAARGPAADAPTLIVSIYARPKDRPALRAALVAAQTAALRRWRASGLLAGYELLFARYADRGSWDAMEVLRFADDAALAAWRRVERDRPGGLDAAALALADGIETAVADDVRNGGSGSAADPAILAIPYRVAIPEAEYLRYLDGYTIPQLRGWAAAGVLDGYEIAFCRFPAGRRWSALLLLRYRDDAALARRAQVVASVRARLATDRTWKSYSDSKHALRTELAVTVADRLAARDVRRTGRNDMNGEER